MKLSDGGGSWACRGRGAEGGHGKSEGDSDRVEYSEEGEDWAVRVVRGSNTGSVFFIRGLDGAWASPRGPNIGFSELSVLRIGTPF